MKKPSPKLIKQRLSGTRNPDSITKPTSKKTLEKIARKWTSRGFYASPSVAMVALMNGVK